MVLALFAAGALLVLGVVASFIPFVPGGALSIAGVLLYWLSTGYAAPGTGFVIAAVLTGLLALAVDYAGGAIAARVGGASLTGTALAAVVGLLLVPAAGPAGLLVGVAGTVFVVESIRARPTEQGLKAAAYAAVGVLASTAVQAILTGAILVGFVAALL